MEQFVILAVAVLGIVTLLTLGNRASMRKQPIVVSIMREVGEVSAMQSGDGKLEEIYLAGGCFWGVEEYFKQIDGVVATDVGYINGCVENPSYELVCEGNTGFAEAVHILYDPHKAPLEFLLSLFYEIIDPTSVNRQGNDCGPQYRTGIYYTNAKDLGVIAASLKKLEKQVGKRIVVECAAVENYYPAEEYHQDYLEKHPFGYCHISRDKFDRARGARPQ